MNSPYDRRFKKASARCYFRESKINLGEINALQKGLRMSSKSSCQVPGWKSEETMQAEDNHQDAFFVRFRSNKGQVAYVHSSDTEVSRDFKAANARCVLHLILKTYIENIGDPPRELYSKNLGPHLHHAQQELCCNEKGDSV
jgi:hypothetical protein